MDHPSSVPSLPEPPPESGLIPTKRRERTPEILAFLWRTLDPRFLDIEVPKGLRDLPRRGYKTFAAVLIERLARLEWRGNDQRSNDAAVLRRVAHGLLGLRWERAEEDRPALDKLREGITSMLQEHAPLWDAERGSYFVPRRLSDFVKTLERHPVVGPLVVSARAQLAVEYEGDPIRISHPGGLFTWHPGGVAHRAVQLAREIGDGRNLAARMRDQARYHRKVGDLPPAVRKQDRTPNQPDT